MYKSEFIHELYALFPDITTNKSLRGHSGGISITKLMHFTRFDQTDHDNATYDDFYNYLVERKHLYEWWQL